MASKKSGPRWKRASEDSWRKCLENGKCIRGCDVSKVACIHLSYYLLKTGDVKPYVEMDIMPYEEYEWQSTSNDEVEEQFRDYLKKYKLSRIQTEVLVLIYVYDLPQEEVGKELGIRTSSVKEKLTEAEKIIGEDYTSKRGKKK